MIKEKEINLTCLEKRFRVDDIIKNIGYVEGDIVYLAGSAIEREVGKYSHGIGNMKSDIDVFIFRNYIEYENTNQYEYNEGFRKVNFVNINNTSFDIEIYNISEIENLIEDINLIKIEGDERITNSLKLKNGWNLYNVNSLLNRMVYSIPIKKIKRFNEIKSKINFEKFTEFYVNFTMNNIDNAYDDLMGSLIDNQLDVALFNVRNIFLNLLQLIIYKEKEYVDRQKWIVPKFKNICNILQKYKEELRVYEKLFLSDLKNEIMLEQTIRECINFINSSVENFVMESDEYEYESI